MILELQAEQYFKLWRQTNMATLITLVIALCILALALYLVQITPMDATLRNIIRIVLVIILIVWLLNLLYH